MSSKFSDNKEPEIKMGPGKLERYIQPSILMGLFLTPSYGYKLIQNIQKFGFVKGQAPPGMIYRHLRQLEEEGLVSSEWMTEGTGPAKRVYSLTPEGKEVLAIWVEYMKQQAKNLNAFIAHYQKAKKRKPEKKLVSSTTTD